MSSFKTLAFLGLLLWASPAFAQIDPAAWCRGVMGGKSQSGTQDGKAKRLIIESTCAIIPAQSLLEKKDGSLNTSLTTWFEDLSKLDKWSVVEYRVMIANDWDHDVWVNFSDWDVTHSPLYEIAGSFEIEIPACTAVRYMFYSPSEPQLLVTPVNTRFLRERPSVGTVIQGNGQASLYLPKIHDYYHPLADRRPKTAIEDAATGCQSH